MTARLLRVTTLKHHGLWRLKDGRKVFLKVSGSSFRSQMSSMNSDLEREKTCMQVLQGLAIPELVKVAKDDLPRFPGPRKLFIMAQSYAGGQQIHHLRLKPHELVGVWVFFVEQLVAFRRHGIVYTDFKCANIMGQRAPLRATIVDFNFAFALSPDRKDLPYHGVTPGFISPEVMRNETGTEQSLVYECALLLFHFLTNANNSGLDRQTRGLSKARQLLDEMGAPPLALLLGACLEKTPARRPKDYEDMLARIETGALPPKIKKVWESLRAPYAQRLAQAGLEA